MKEKVHKGLTSLVLREGIVHLDPNLINKIIYASIEPDTLNKQEIKENLLRAPGVLFNWWKDHTLWARNLALSYTKEAKNAYKSNSYYWTQYLGWAFHFITDHATPYHSPNKLTPMLNSIQEDYKEGANNLKGYSAKSQVAGGLLNIGAKIFSKAINLKMEHDDFESYCDNNWINYERITSEIFQKLKNSNNFIINLGLIEKKIDYLHENYKDITLEWINTDNNYANYMAEIAMVMNLVYEFVLE